MQETLVIIHLSSLEASIRGSGRDAALRLVLAIHQVILKHAGPVVFLDYAHAEEYLSPLADSLRACTMYLAIRPVKLYNVHPWQDVMNRLAHMVGEGGTQHVRLGGFWISPDSLSGCVPKIQQELTARHIPCSIDRSICAIEEHDPCYRQR